MTGMCIITMYTIYLLCVGRQVYGQDHGVSDRERASGGAGAPDVRGGDDLFRRHYIQEIRNR